MAYLKGYKRIAIIDNGTQGNEYYYALYDDDICVGDMVCVTGMAIDKILKVKNILNADENTILKYKWLDGLKAEIICRVNFDTTAYDQRVEARNKEAELRKRLEIKRKEIETRKDDDYYASLDSEYAQMLKELREIEM